VKTDIDTLLVLLRLIFGSRLRLRAHVALGALQEGLSVASGVAAPFLLKGIVDHLSKPNPWTFQLSTQVALFVAAWSAGGLFGGTKLVSAGRIVESVVAHLSAGALREQLPMIADGRVDSQRVFGVLERLPYSVQVVVDGVLWRLAPLLVQLLASLVAVALLTPRFALLLFVFLSVYGLLADRGGRRCRDWADSAYAASNDLSRFVGDVLTNAQRVVFNGGLTFEDARFAAVSGRRQTAANALANSVAELASLQFITLLIGQGLVLMIAARDVAAGRLGLGVFVLLQAFAFRLSAPLGGVGILLKDTVSALANLRDVLTLQGSPSRLLQLSVVPIRNDIEANDIAFTYDGAPTGLQAISVRLTPGAFVVLVGPNGSGKSTLAKILSGHLTPDVGQVLIGGVPLSDLDRDQRHTWVHYVPQFIGLFNRSLRENALYPPTTLSDAELERKLHAWRFSDDGHPVDLDLAVGEQGARLSGGQIQKLELARLCGLDVPILILDESTSALDPTSERQIVNALREGRPSRTLILITHRLALASSADLVLFLQAGRLIATGPHAQILRQSEAYRRYWSGQTPAPA
jgi:ABC-type multidrug transport system fused ATPase/permease subunit